MFSFSSKAADESDTAGSTLNAAEESTAQCTMSRETWQVRIIRESNEYTAVIFRLSRNKKGSEQGTGKVRRRNVRKVAERRRK